MKKHAFAIVVIAIYALYEFFTYNGNNDMAVYKYGEKKQAAKNYVELLETSKDNCNSGVHAACRDVVGILTKGPTTLRDINKAIEYVGIGCDAGDSDMCIAMSYIYLMPAKNTAKYNDDYDIAKILENFDNVSVEADFKKSIDYLKKACKNGYCGSLISLYRGKNKRYNEIMGQNAESYIDYDEAVKIYIEQKKKLKDGCDGECYIVVTKIYLEEAKNVSKAKEYALKSCDLHQSGNVCYELSLILEHFGDSDTARILAINGCNKGIENSRSCRLYEQKYQ